jgi:hypothetical protein
VKDTIAVDLACLLPSEVGARAKAMNAALLRREASGLRLDERHLPHITLVQQCILESARDDVVAAAERVIGAFAPLELRAEHTQQGRATSHLVIEPHPELQGMHEQLLEALAPFAQDEVEASAFHDDGEPPRPQDVEWVRGFRRRASGAAFWPHVTLGVGPPPALEQGFSFVVDHLALCRLGRFCTCRAALFEWRLR